MQSGRLEHNHETANLSLKLESRTAVCLQADHNGARAYLNLGLTGVQNLDAIAENELKDWKRASRHGMHNCGCSGPNLTMGAEPDVFPKRQRGTCEADNVHCFETEVCYRNSSTGWHRSCSSYRASHFTRPCQCTLGPMTPARSGPDINIPAAIAHVKG